jgi:aminoglycoside phosphotransferase (APT) family kinase protein
VLSITTPPEPVLRWAADQMGMGASVIAVQGLKDGVGPWLLRIRHAGEMTQAVLRLGDPDHPERLATEAAALALAKDHNMAAPRLLGVDLVGPAGMPAELMTVLPGTSRIPAVASTERLRAMGAAAAAMHAVPLAPGPDLPLRVRPIADVDFSAERRATGSSSLLEAAEARLQELPAPAGLTVFVHGDLWQGNCMWSGEEFVGVVDWEQAGAGHPGVDLGWLRSTLPSCTAPTHRLRSWTGGGTQAAVSPTPSPIGMRWPRCALPRTWRTGWQCSTVRAAPTWASRR